MGSTSTSAPDSIGKYRVIAKLGQGGMARVLLTVASGKAGFEKLLVVKELREELAYEPEFLTMFLDEARLAARLNHPNVVHTYEVGQDGDRHFIAMDYLDGQPLSSVLRKVGRRNFPLDLHVRILADMLSGLDYAHRLADFDGTPLRVVHRDVSPQNVFITFDGQVKVVDFGIAKAIGASTTTKTGVYKGKAGYIAPEQAKAAPVDARADVFAVGVMLWEALAERRMATGETDLAVLAMRIGGMDCKVLEAAPDAPPELAAVCDRAMALEAADRFESASDMRDALEAWLDAQPKRVSSKDLGAYLAKAFATESAELRLRIDEHLKLVRESAHGPVPVLDIAAPGARSDVTPTPLHDPEEAETVQASNVTASTQVGAPVRRAPARMVLIAGAAVASVLAFAFFGLRSDRAAAPPIPADMAPATVELVIHVPTDAVATLDGAVLRGSPFRGRFPRGGPTRTLEVEAPGHVTEKRLVDFERDLDLTIALRPWPASSAERSAVASASARASKATAPRDPVAALPTGAAATGKPSGPPSGSQLDIDEKNPYGK